MRAVGWIDAADALERAAAFLGDGHLVGPTWEDDRRVDPGGQLSVLEEDARRLYERRALFTDAGNQ